MNFNHLVDRITGYQFFYPSKHLYIQDEKARDYDGGNMKEACVDERGSAEVAVAGKWEVGDDFGRNTFCLVLGKMTHYPMKDVL